ncbi:uncharacterized protein FOMMEDRAFT_160755 [Fomitiporia mediterranea MF3/22]|uniref:uncharacterized protein n=1 Tax=Fomitiporia mediterranea (strain MF3/22) TaxID=694068 RepID=UPI0004407CA7|nr:uncharacterized protein FOMMEDRAFT_160755 [Fomitiporia mediterranea MF3/22]EJC99183.1 hypothetical protein FOMMEDRAFT_160755 [Fomitiporia mediterranea MF3/22]
MALVQFCSPYWIKPKMVPRLTGTIGLSNTSVANQTTEIGFVVVLPEFQRTHVASNAIGLLHYCLKFSAGYATSELKYGPRLGLQRVQWEGKTGTSVSPEHQALRAGPGRDALVLSLCWDDWDLDSTRATVQQQMDSHREDINTRPVQVRFESVTYPRYLDNSRELIGRIQTTSIKSSPLVREHSET